MRAWAALIAFAVLATTASAAPSEYDRHVLFDNSLADGALYYSDGSVTAPSELELVGGKIPVDASRFVSPPNCFRLSWRSLYGGDWQASLNLQKHYRRNELAGSTLSFWCYADAEVVSNASPLIYLLDSDGRGTPSIKLLWTLASIPARMWTRVRLPIDTFVSPTKGTDDATFDARKLARITFVQGLDDGERHTLLVDDIRLADEDATDKQAPAAPSGITAKGYDRHVDVSWTRSAEPDVASYTIYRSTDGSAFAPIGVQRGSVGRYADFLGASGRTASYKVTALDWSGNESPMSTVATASTRALSDDELLSMVQEANFRYYWDAAHPKAGMAIEILPGDENLVALGASGFGVMALCVAVQRGFITREQGVERMLEIVRFLAKADRFHGVWPHFLDGYTGKVNPYFGKYDDGGDLVETAFMMQGLLTARQYFDRDSAGEREIRDTITGFWNTVEWDWYRKEPTSDVLYWHWSPDYGFHISHPLVGWNETMIIYLLAIASPTHAVPASMFHTGWAGQGDVMVRYRRGWSRTTQGDHYVNGNTYYGHKLDVGVGNGSETFFTQFSFFAFDPRGKRDRYTNYFENNRAITLIAHDYAVANPMKRVGYGDDAWGRSAGVNAGSGRSTPAGDNGTLTIEASLGCFPYAPDECMKALKHYYRDLGAKVWGIYGFHDGFNQTENWFEEVYMGLNQAPTVIMIENHRTGLVWNTFMKNPEIAPALKAIGFGTEPRTK